MFALTASRLTLDAQTVGTEPVGWLREAVETGLSRAGGLVLLGAFGSGKTHLVHQLAVDGLGTAVPLRLLDPSLPVAEALAKVIGRQRLDAALDGSRPLLLDGLDEAQYPADRFQQVFAEITETVGPRWLLTSRPGFFRTEAEAGDDQVDSLEPGIPTLLIDPIPPDRVATMLEALGGAQLVETVDGLADLATSPMLLRVVEAALPFIEPGRPIQAWGLFDAWIRHALSTGSGHDDVVARLEQLAWETAEAHDHRPTGVRFPKAAVDRLKIPGSIRSALMVTDLDGAWRFGHRSVLEFLFAGYLAPRLAAGQGQGPDRLSGILLTDATRAFLVGRLPPMPVVLDRGRVRIPRGNFVAGGDRGPDERPLRIQHLAEAVWVARQPVTSADWAAYLERWPDDRVDINYLSHWGPSRRCPAGREQEPVHNLWPADADLYASRAGARLPTADEWEKAVRGIDGRTWPWGDHWRPGRGVTAELGVTRPLPVRAFGAHGDSGLFGAIGGVFEYTSTAYRGREDRGRVVMGGCYTHPASAARPSLRLSHKLSGNLKTGLRLAWDDDT
ncbi:MAG: SUMF1/EgtB/PvdO family nonheme iron enzyme [Alphaproteobacteria bacterium]|nr:SUMF1/EgtB/PvdO family nonheme iron enzyme [Alphaproteobacteria bacterium]